MQGARGSTNQQQGVMTMIITINDKDGFLIDMFESDESRAIATNKAIDKAHSMDFSVFAVYVDNQLDCFTECLRYADIPRTLSVRDADVEHDGNSHHVYLDA
jgi:hypothetical protein